MLEKVMPVDAEPDAPPEAIESSTSILRPASSPLWQKVLGMGLAFYACAEGGRLLSPADSPFVTFWLPGGLYVAALLLNAFRTWPWFMLAAFLANLVFDLSHGESFPIIICFYCANTIQAVIGAWLVRRFVSPRSTLGTLREFLGFMGLVGIVSAMLGAVLAATTLTIAGMSLSFAQSWRIWWGSNAMAVLTLSPFIIVWFSKLPSMRQHLQQRNRGREAFVCFLGLISGAWWFLAHGGGITIPNKAPLLLFLLWAGLRLGVRSVVAANFLLSLLFAFLTSHFHRGLTPADLLKGDYVFYLQIQMAVASFVGLVPALVLKEHDETLAALGASEERYRTLFESAEDGILMMRRDCFVSCNPKGLKLFGCGLEQIVGQTPLRFSPVRQPDGQDSVAKARGKDSGRHSEGAATL
jgi:integral membrane sensor domain MASE1